MGQVIVLDEYRQRDKRTWWQEVWMLSDTDLRLAIYMVKQALESNDADDLINTKEFNDWITEFHWAIRYHSEQADFSAGYDRWRGLNA